MCRVGVVSVEANDAINGWEAIGAIRRWRKFEQTDGSRQHDDRGTATADSTGLDKRHAADSESGYTSGPWNRFRAR